jgi:hypothetical protein
MPEGNVGKFTSPFSSDTDSIKCSHKDVTYNKLSFIFQTLQFNDVFGEPDGVHSLDCVWKLSYKCFELWKRLCDILMTTFYGICIAAEWGCEFAYIAFWHIWIISPLMKIFVEYRSTSLATRYNTTVHNVGVDSLTDTTSYFKDLHER